MCGCRYGPKGTAAFTAFQAEMNALLKNLEARGEPSPDDTDIGTQLLRVMKEHPSISRDRVLSEIGILFVEGFETTGRLRPEGIRNQQGGLVFD